MPSTHFMSCVCILPYTNPSSVSVCITRQTRAHFDRISILCLFASRSRVYIYKAVLSFSTMPYSLSDKLHFTQRTMSLIHLSSHTPRSVLDRNYLCILGERQTCRYNFKRTYGLGFMVRRSVHTPWSQTDCRGRPWNSDIKYKNSQLTSLFHGNRLPHSEKQ